MRRFGPGAVEQLLVRRDHPHPHERGVRDRERERRPERVERADEVDVAGQDHRDRRDPREERDREPRRLEARVQPPEDLRDLAVGRHRVGDPGGADHACVRGDEEDRRGEDADIDLERVEQGAFDAEVLDDAEDRIVRVAALLRRQRQQGRQLAADLDHRQRRERDQRQREVDREDRERHEPVGVGNVLDRVAHLLGEVGDGLHPRVRKHRHRDRDREVPPGRRDAPVDVVDEDLRAEDEHEAERDEQHLRREVDHRERDRQPRRLLDADDVEHDERDDDDDPADDVPGVLPQRLPEDREVVRDEEGRRGDGDDVDEHLRPGGAERDELVEGVPGEAGGAAGLGEPHRPLGVGGRGGGEDDARRDEDERRQPERVDGGEAECVVDRRADVAVRGGEQRGRAEDTLQLDLPATSAWHRRTVLVAQVWDLRKQIPHAQRPLKGRFAPGLPAQVWDLRKQIPHARKTPKGSLRSRTSGAKDPRGVASLPRDEGPPLPGALRVLQVRRRSAVDADDRAGLLHSVGEVAHLAEVLRPAVRPLQDRLTVAVPPIVAVAGPVADMLPASALPSSHENSV